MRLGTHMEPFIGQLFARRTGNAVFQNTKLYRHPQYEFATATPDFFVDVVGIEGQNELVKLGEGILECKNTSAHRLDDWKEGNIPNYAHLQIIWQMGIVGMARGWVAALVGANPNDFFTPPVEFDQSVFAQCIELAEKFMEMVKSDTPPAAKTADVKLLEKWHEREEREIVMPDEAERLLAEWDMISYELEQFSAQTEPLEGRKNDIKAQLLQMLQGATVGRIGDRIVTAKTVNRASYVAKATSYTSFKVK